MSGAGRALYVRRAGGEGNSDVGGAGRVSKPGSVCSKASGGKFWPPVLQKGWKCVPGQERACRGTAGGSEKKRSGDGGKIFQDASGAGGEAGAGVPGAGERPHRPGSGLLQENGGEKERKEGDRLFRYGAFCPEHSADQTGGEGGSQPCGTGVPAAFCGNSHRRVSGQQSGTGISAEGGVRGRGRAV